MKKIFMFLTLILTLCSCDETSPIATNQNIDLEFGMNCVGVVEGLMATIFYRCENKEAICYMSYNGSSVNCKWKGK